MGETLKGPTAGAGYFLIVGIAVIVLYWLLEAAADSFLFHLGDFSGALFPVLGHELWTRLVTTFLLIVVIVSAYLHLRRQGAQRLALEQERDLKRAMVEASPAFFVAIDAQGKTLLMNRAMTDALGYAAEEVEGTDYLESFIPEDEREEVEKVFRRLIDNQESTHSENHVKTRDGRLLLVEWYGRPILKPDDEFDYLVGFGMDVTEHRRAKKELEESEARSRLLATVVEQATEGILVMDTERIVRYVNPAFETITGYPTDEVVGKPSEYVNSREHPGEFYREIWRKLEAGENWFGRFSNRNKNGALYHVDVAFSPVRDESGRIINHVAIMRDVTQEVALEQQLMRAQKMEAIGNLAAGIAHDFNNVLSIILGLTAILKEDVSPGSPAEDDLNQIEDAGRRAADLTRQLLMFSRRQIAEKKPLDVNEVVRNLEKMIKRLIGENIEFRTRLDARHSVVKADLMQMEQVVMNLVVNARDAMPRGGDAGGGDHGRETR